VTVKLNESALRHAKKLVRDGRVVHDERDDWSEHALPAKKETAWREEHGWDEYARWHLGIDTDENEETKAHYSFPFGDYEKVHRCAVISLESRAAQYDHDEIAAAAKELLELIDAE
jgi:hypothetical protein